MPLAAMLLVWFSVGPGELRAAGAPLQKNAADKAEASKESATEAVPRVSLDEIMGSPGASLMIPFYYTPDPKEPLRALSADVEFVSNHLKFQKSSRGVIPDDVSAEITTNVTDGKPDDKGVVKSKLHVTVSLTDKNPKKGLPEGLLAFLLFQVTMDAKPFTIKLTPTLVSGEDINNPPRKIAKITGVPGTVVVEIPDILPEATCFFFSH
jgi:hypothetical protein